MIVNFLFDTFIPETIEEWCNAGEPWWNMPDIPWKKAAGDYHLRPKFYSWWRTSVVDALTADNPNIAHENEIRMVNTLDHELKSDEINIYPVFIGDKVFEQPSALLWLPQYIVNQVNVGLVHLIILNYFEGDYLDYELMKHKYIYFLRNAGIANFNKVSIVGNSYLGEKKINSLKAEDNDINYVTCHAWEKYPLKYLHTYQVDTSNYLYENKSKIFLMPIRSARSWRYFTYKYLEYFGVLDKGLYSYVINVDPDQPADIQSTDNFDNHRHNSFAFSNYPHQEELVKTDFDFLFWLNQYGHIDSKSLPYHQLDNTKLTVENTAFVHNRWIKETYFSVVCEAIMNDRSSMITEKTFRTIYYGHPFIIVGSPGILAELRSMGYETFPELFDESYDDMDSSIGKIKFIAEQINKWCDESRRDELNQIMKEIYPKIVHNRNLYISKDHSKFWNNFK